MNDNRTLNNTVFMNSTAENCRILAKGKYINNNTRETGLNNNDLVIGVSGAGKTRGYVMPNVLQGNESMIVVDTKNQLCKTMSEQLKEKGYEIWKLDFVHMEDSPMGYNPLRFIERTGRDSYNTQDVEMLSKILCPTECLKDPFWDQAAGMQVSTLIAYVLEALPENEHHLGSVARMQQLLNTNTFDHMMEEWESLHPESFAVKKWHLFKDTRSADKTNASAAFILGEKLSTFLGNGCQKMFMDKKQVNFRMLGAKKVALFLNVSDSDRSADKLVNLLYTQALHELCEAADSQSTGRLRVPVRLIMDDFASNAVIPDFDKIISVIRSREIYVSLILQSLTQLYSMYDENRAMTIINNCDTCLYLGGQDVKTATYMGVKANKTPDTILNMPVGDAWLFVRGQKPQQVEKFDVTQHESYRDPFAKNCKLLSEFGPEDELPLDGI